MRLRALSLEGNIVYFNVAEAPMRLNDNQTLLCNKCNSPIFLTKTIARGPDDGAFYEFDFVCHKTDCKFLGYVVYVDGFYYWNPKTEDLTPIRDASLYTFVENARAYKGEGLVNIRSAIRLNSQGRTIGLGRIIYSDGENVWTEIKTNRPTKADELSLCTGIEINGKELFFGQYLERGCVSLHDYHPMLYTPSGEYEEIERSDYE